MHTSSTFAVALSFAAGALAQRWHAQYGTPRSGRWHCLNETGVTALVDGYTYLLEKPGGPSFNSTAEAILSSKFFVDSDSILTLSQRPVSVAPRSESLARVVPSIEGEVRKRRTKL